jgi:hypothetical protein
VSSISEIPVELSWFISISSFLAKPQAERATAQIHASIPARTGGTQQPNLQTSGQRLGTVTGTGSKEGGFGNRSDHAGTSWTTSDIWMRKHFNPRSMSADQMANLVIRDIHVGAVEVFINGVRAYSERGRSNSWEYRSISSEARASIRPNADNVLSVHCARGTESQFIDEGVNERTSAEQ